ncbi:MFS general substrate transporter [Byssothecium circinans]|uniref:MFS general substrate transporter n=1 Tax=Byssothecium circinans TaxID=147558 RepID=A0A6A5T9T4_9PLEO|nr:MFS general substrate transporter [Byssothecium circinans]
MTVFVGIFCYWMVFDFPDTARFLTPDERLRAQRRLRADNQTRAEEEKISRKYVFQAVKDWKTWLFALQYMGCLCALYSFSLFLPTIMVGMGYKGNRAQLMSVPPYAVAAAMTVFIGWLADRTKWRGYCNMAVALMGCVGFAMLLGSKNVHVQYAGTFLGAAGIYPTVPNTLSWASNNVEGSLKRGVMVGIVVGWGNMNGVVSSNIYNKPDSPRYLTGHAIVFAYMFVCLFGGSVATHILLKRENKLRKAGKRDSWIEGKSAQEIFDLGDRRPDFIYTT